MAQSLRLQKEHWQAMERHVRAQAPLEACGLLAGRNDRVEKVFLMQNAAQSPVRYRLDGAEQLQVFEAIEAAGMELVGIFHSHPQGSPFPSSIDIREAAYPVVYLIWAPQADGWIARGFRIEAGKVTEVELLIEES
ncbi:MAG: M67 family metallopeptidase [Anaerolineales bacterium]